MLTVDAWVVFWNPASLPRFEQRAPSMGDAMPEYFVVGPDGTVKKRDIPKDAWAKFVRIARANRVKIWGMASNFGAEDFEPDRMAKTLATPQTRQAHALALATIAKADGLDGVDLDYESMRAQDREPYSDLVRRLARELHKRGKKLSVTVHPKFEEPGTWDGTKAQDWAAIGKAADVVRVMTYDQHWSTSDAGPIAADAWVEGVAKFALTKIPASKLSLGVCGYGYDWSKRPAASLTFPDFPATGWTLDPDSGERVIGQARFGGPESLARKIALARRLGVRSVSLWYVGSEAPDPWPR